MGRRFESHEELGNKHPPGFLGKGDGEMGRMRIRRATNAGNRGFRKTTDFIIVSRELLELRRVPITMRAVNPPTARSDKPIIQSKNS